MNRTLRSRARWWLTASTAATLTIGLGAVAVPASAHEGHDDEAAAPAADPALETSNYERNLITRDVGEPIDMAVLPDGRVLTTARGGDIRLHDPSLGTTEIVNEVDVYVNSEDGLQGIALDPEFEDNGWVYFVYAPRDADGDGAQAYGESRRCAGCEPPPRATAKSTIHRDISLKGSSFPAWDVLMRSGHPRAAATACAWWPDRLRPRRAGTSVTRVLSAISQKMRADRGLSAERFAEREISRADRGA